MMAQAIELGNRPHVVVATPGRIVDHLRSSNGEWDLSRIKFLVRPLKLLGSSVECLLTSVS
jgi:ATP-dependent RNA helicase DDX49/DBP8